MSEDNPQQSSTMAKDSSFISRISLIDSRVAANLVMLLAVVIGLVSLNRINVQTLPDAVIPVITISTVWNGASANDVDNNVIAILQQEVRYIEGVKSITSYARDGGGSIVLEFDESTDMQTALFDVDSAVNSTNLLPIEAEKPVVKLISFRNNVINVAMEGDVDEKLLKKYAKELQNGLLEQGVSQVDLKGYRSEEIYVKLTRERLLRLNLDIDDISRSISKDTLNRSIAGTTGESGAQIRTGGFDADTQELKKINVIARSNGQKVPLEDIAVIETHYSENDSNLFSQGKRIIELIVKRKRNDDALKITQISQEYIEDFSKRLPAGISVNIYDLNSKYIEGRINLLIKNATQGLFLVTIVLFIFMTVRIAFWIAIGIPIATISAILVMYLSGETINMISLFVMIMMIGIIVDDAIIIGEHGYTLIQSGMPPRDAMLESVRRMFAPVMAAMLTTICGFIPIFLISDVIGQLMKTIPIVAISVIIASVIEAFLILPGHIRHSYEAAMRKGMRAKPLWRQKFDSRFKQFEEKFGLLVAKAIRYPHLTLLSFTCLVIISVSLLVFGKIKFEFFPSAESEKIYLKINYTAGLTLDKRLEIGTQIEKNTLNIIDSIKPDNENPVIISILETHSGGYENVATVNFQLTDSETRKLRTKTIIEAIRKDLPSFEGVISTNVGVPRGGPPGRDVEVNLQGQENTILKKASLELQEDLRKIIGISNISDDLPYGKKQITLQLKPKGKLLGFTTDTLTKQLRNAYQGSIARYQPNENEDIAIIVKIKDLDTQGIVELENYLLTLPNSKEKVIQLREIATITESKNFAVILRDEGIRTIKVLGDIDSKITSVGEVTAELKKVILPRIEKKYDITTKIGGRSQEQGEAFKDMAIGFILALSLMYVVIAWVFDNYYRPFVIMSIIPFGLLGALTGHYFMGHNFTILSAIGLLALSGVLVNASIVYVNEFELQLSKGESYMQSLVIAAKNRIRAILLTSLTTIGGLTPLMFEKSLQAQFLIPMTISIVFGLATATMLVLLVLPSILIISKNYSTFFLRLRNLGKY